MLLNYETLLLETDSTELIVKEKPLKYNDGRIKGKRIAIRKDIKTTKEKGCVLAEELGHYHTTSGDIIDQSSTNNRKQEYRARLWAYNKVIGLSGIIASHKAGCHSLYEMAEYLNVTEQFLKEGLECYRNKYGTCTTFNNYIITFEPSLGVLELI